MFGRVSAIQKRLKGSQIVGIQNLELEFRFGTKGQLFVGDAMSELDFLAASRWGRLKFIWLLDQNVSTSLLGKLIMICTRAVWFER